MKPTDELKIEHQAIKRMLKVMSGACGRLEKGAAVDAGHLESIVDFIQIFADKCHHGKEEDLLFPAMVEAGFSREQGPIAVMLAEHTQGRASVRRIKDAAAAYRSALPGAGAEIARNARAYVGLLGPHIDKEDMILYPMADQALSSATQKELLRAFERVENEIVGAGRHERYHALIEELEGIYLAD
jgi:hemerythrin-like domain-containing protein